MCLAKIVVRDSTFEVVNCALTSPAAVLLFDKQHAYEKRGRRVPPYNSRHDVEKLVPLFTHSHMVVGVKPTATLDTTSSTLSIFKYFLRDEIDKANDANIPLPELIERARIRFVAETFHWWDCILWTISSTLDGIDASMSNDSLVKSNIPEWRRLWCNWRGLLTNFETILQQTKSWIEGPRGGPKFGSDGLPELKSVEQRIEDRKRLERRIEASFQVLMSTMSIIESRNAVSQGESIGKLTELAFIFIPLSFATSFFGMEIKVGHQGADFAVPPNSDRSGRPSPI